MLVKLWHDLRLELHKTRKNGKFSVSLCHIMKAFILLISFVSTFLAIHSLNIIGISKVICHFSRFNYAEILKGENAIVNISKTLFNECDIKVKIVSDLKELKKDFILFTKHNSDDKERF